MILHLLGLLAWVVVAGMLAGVIVLALWVAMAVFLRWSYRAPVVRLATREEHVSAASQVISPDRPLAPVRFLSPVCFVGEPYDPALELWNLTEDIDGHPKGSTVTRRTLEAAGYHVPPMPFLSERLTPDKSVKVPEYERRTWDGRQTPPEKGRR